MLQILILLVCLVICLYVAIKSTIEVMGENQNEKI